MTGLAATNLTAPDRAQTELSAGQRPALTTAATRPAGDVDGIFGAETIERFLHSGYERFATVGSIPDHLPPLSERFARQRLQDLARVEGHHGKPVVLFLCTHNAGRSQMPWASSPTSPATPRSRGRAVPSRGSTSTCPRPPAPDPSTAGGSGLPAAAPWRSRTP